MINMPPGRDVLILYNYFLFAADMRARFLKGDAPSCQPVSSGAVPEAAIISMLYDRAWLAGLYAVVEGWTELGLKTPASWEGSQAPYLGLCQEKINEILGSPTGKKTTRERGGPEVDETFEDLLRRARNKVFHFEPAYTPDAIRRFHMEAEAPHRWPQQLHDWFVQFFAAWFQSASQ